MKRAIVAAFFVALAAIPLFGARDAQAYSQTGVASYYWQGKVTANGERYKPDGISAAHKTLPFGTRVKVTHLGSGRSIVVRINDRGPFIRGRIIDLSRGAAGVLGIKGSGVARVRIDVVGSVKMSKKAKKRKGKKTYAVDVSYKKKKGKKKRKATVQAAAFVAPSNTESLNVTSYQKIAKKK